MLVIMHNKIGPLKAYNAVIIASKWNHSSYLTTFLAMPMIEHN